MSKFNSLRLESLESRVVPTTYEVGPGMAYGDLWQVPWINVGAGDTVMVHWRHEPYHSKIGVNRGGTPQEPLRIIGVSSEFGLKPKIDAADAIENPSAAYYNGAVARDGIFSVIPSNGTYKVTDVFIENLELFNARRENKFTDAKGVIQGYDWGTTAVAIWHADRIVVRNCLIHDNENGIFGKYDIYNPTNGTMDDIVISHNEIRNNGIPGSTHYHNTYLEGWRTVYQFNTYSDAVSAMLKDRSAAPVIRYNRFEGKAARMLDLVEPDENPALLAKPDFGHEWVYGNMIIRPEGAPCAAPVNFGFDIDKANEQKHLYFFNNTVISVNDRENAGCWYQYWFKTGGPISEGHDETIHAYNNIFYIYSPNPKHFPGDVYMVSGNGNLDLGTNWANKWLQRGFPSIMTGWSNLILGFDPGFTNERAEDFRLSANSPCIDQSAILPSWAFGHRIGWQWNPLTNQWVRRSGADQTRRNRTHRTAVGCLRNGRRAWGVNPMCDGGFRALTRPARPKSVDMEGQLTLT